MFLLLLACSDPVEAPEDLEELTIFLYEEWDNEEPEYLELALVNLLEHAETVDFEARWDERSWDIGPLDPAELEGKVEHGRDVSVAEGVGVMHQSTFPLEDFLALQFLEDQTPVEPTSPDHYVRTVTEGADCFGERTCDVLRTDNDITRSTFIYDVTYDLPKEFRWVALDEEERQAFCARSWMPNSAQDGDKITLWQGYSADVWVPRDGGTLRYQVSWQETEMPGLTWEQVRGVVAGGIDDMFETQDEYLAEQ